MLLEEAESSLPIGQRAGYEAFRTEIERSDDFHDLPHALIHPDFVPANVVESPDAGLVVIDWTGAGRGPRISSSGFLLWAAGGRDL